MIRVIAELIGFVLSLIALVAVGLWINDIVSWDAIARSLGPALAR